MLRTFSERHILLLNLVVKQIRSAQGHSCVYTIRVEKKERGDLVKASDDESIVLILVEVLVEEEAVPQG